MARGLALMFSGARLRQARSQSAHGALSAAELGDRVGASKAQILAYESGQRVPDPPRIRRLAEALGVHPLQLANQNSLKNWKLADLRRANGLRASDLCDELGLKLHSYRRLETQGLTAEGRYGLTPRLATALGVSMRALERHIGNVPAVRQRLEGIGETVTALLETHLAPGRTDVPEVADELVKEIAACYTRPVATVARILCQETRALRERRRRQAVEAAAAYYGPTAEEQQRARRRMESEDAQVDQLIASLPQRLDVFFRAQLSPESWETLCRLHFARSDERTLSMLSPLVAGDTALTPMVRPVRGTAAEYQGRLYDIARDGQHHYVNFKNWYEALYPWVEDSLRHSARLTTASNPPELVWLRQCFAQSQTILFSFDGILCKLFAGNVRSVSGQLAQAASSLHLRPETSNTADPVALLRSVVDCGSPDQIRHLDGILTTYETNAARHAEPLPGAAQLLGALSRGPWRLAVVTDHASAAVQTFLAHLGPGTDSVPELGVFGRPTDPRLMKPHPHAVALATSRLGGDRARTLLIGESLADALAARAAGVQFIGVATHQRHARMLKEAGATNVVDTLATLLAAVRRLNEGHE
ncbi:helix-turn-helix domain-containing protein [Streptomyces rochei]|nr:helix-turn-helix domain-containing protein [Streptomyces sp. KAI 90]NUV97727.1 helix-turn-helix domain-containing protein [Streptomyces sp. KAI 90]